MLGQLQAPAKPLNPLAPIVGGLVSRASIWFSGRFPQPLLSRDYTRGEGYLPSSVEGCRRLSTRETFSVHWSIRGMDHPLTSISLLHATSLPFSPLPPNPPGLAWQFLVLSLPLLSKLSISFTPDPTCSAL